MTRATRKRFILVPLALASLTLVVACGGAESRKAKYMGKGQEYLATGNLEKARVEFRNALQIAPNDSQARFENGVVAEKLGNPRQAAGFYQGAIDANPDNLPARVALARLYVLGGAPQQSLDTLTPAIAKHPDDPGVLTVRAAAKVQLKDPAGALADAERAFRLAPDNEDTVAVLAGIYQASGQSAKAESLLQDAVKRNPATVQLRLTLAQLESGLNKQSEVEALLIDLVRLKPEDKANRLRLAQFYARLDQPDEAERVLRDGIKALPAERDLKVALVDFLAARRSREAAEKELIGFVAAYPKDYELKYALAQFYAQGKEVPKAEAVYRGVIADAGLEAAGITARDRLAALLIEQHDIPGAEKLIGEVLAKSPRDDDALILRGNLALAHKDPKAAIADLRSVLRDEPNAVGVMRVLARAHLANGEPALAEETMRRAVEANPKDPGARLDLAELLTQIGKPEQAKPVIDELVEQQPNNLQALQAQFKIAAGTKDMVSAKAAADAIVALDPKLALGYYYQGLIAENDKHPDEALNLFAKALEIQPDSSEPLEASTRVLLNQKRSAEALKRLDDVIAKFPQAPIAANLKGEVLLSLQRPADAESAFKIAMERQPTWWTPYRNLAAAQYANHENDALIATLRAGIAKASAPQSLEIDLAGFYERMGQPDEAAKVYEAALRRDPQSDVAANNLAMLLVTYKKDQADLDRAQQLAARFSGSPNPNFLDTYGWVLYKRGDAAAAVAALESASSKTPDSPTSLYHLGMAQALAGQNDAAKDSLSRSLKSGKSFTGMDEAKATLNKLANQAPALAVAPSS